MSRSALLFIVFLQSVSNRLKLWFGCWTYTRLQMSWQGGNKELKNHPVCPLPKRGGWVKTNKGWLRSNLPLKVHFSDFSLSGCLFLCREAKKESQLGLHPAFLKDCSLTERKASQSASVTKLHRWAWCLAGVEKYCWWAETAAVVEMHSSHLIFTTCFFNSLYLKTQRGIWGLSREGI